MALGLWRGQVTSVSTSVSRRFVEQKEWDDGVDSAVIIAFSVPVAKECFPGFVSGGMDH
jgi:hypothetical protein